jgi:O-antigen/teichoic acid export membrane protein
VVTSRLILSLGPSILGIVSGSFEIAVWGYAVSIEGYVYLFVNAINGFFMPQLSRISAAEDEKKEERVLELMIKVGKFILILFGLIFVGFAVLGKDFISMLVGSDYTNAYYCVLLICGYGLIAYPQQIANTYTIVQNKVKERALVSLASFGVYLLLVFFFGLLWGALGIALAVCCSLIVQTVLMNVLYAKKLHLNIGAFFKKCHMTLLPGFLVFTGLSVGISYIPLYGWLGFAVKTCLITATYGVLVWGLMLNKSDKNTLKKMLHK